VAVNHTTFPNLELPHLAVGLPLSLFFPKLFEACIPESGPGYSAAKLRTVPESGFLMAWRGYAIKFPPATLRDLRHNSGTVLHLLSDNRPETGMVNIPKKLGKRKNIF
jgi:hypothetical protein